MKKIRRAERFFRSPWQAAGGQQNIIVTFFCLFGEKRKMKQAQSDEELSLVIADLWCRYLVVYSVTPSPIRIASCCA